MKNFKIFYKFSKFYKKLQNFMKILRKISKFYQKISNVLKKN